mmetsp:Transcript_26928/g.35817  ORF Transcript_26928/g.35817 Transcript_26928/m.35817 type:complete len:95 (-) Transcript_26928:217-501(-)
MHDAYFRHWQAYVLIFNTDFIADRVTLSIDWLISPYTIKGITVREDRGNFLVVEFDVSQVYTCKTESTHECLCYALFYIVVFLHQLLVSRASGC